MKRVKLLLLFFLLVFTFAGCQKQTEPLDEVTLQLKWIHQAQFAGYYIAKEKGFYEEEGIDLTILPGGIGIESLEILSSGEADFAVAAPEQIIVQRSQGYPITAVAVIFQHNPFVLISLADSEIITLSDFPGHSIAVANVAGRVQYDLMMKNAGFDTATLEEVDFTFDYQPFFDREVDILAVFAAGSFLDVVRDGVEVNTFWPDDYGVHWYSDTIAVNETVVTENPELITRFLRATFKGMEYMIANPEEAVEITMQYAEVQDIEVQRAMLYASIPLIYTAEPRIGWMDEEKWFGIRQDLYVMGLIDNLVPMSDIYTTQFLWQIYKDAQ